MKSTSFSKNGETHSRRRHRLQPQSIPFMAKKRIQERIPETPRNSRHTLQGYSKHGSHHRHSRRHNTTRHPTRKPRRHRISLRRHRIPLPQKLHASRSERSHTIPQTTKTQPRETHRPPAWKRMIRSYRRNRCRWMKQYHTRSMAETAFSAIKRTLGHRLTSTRRDHQKLELMTKVIVYNTTVLIKSRQRGV